MASRGSAVTRKRVVSPQKSSPLAAVKGAELLPECRWCAELLVWRGTWQCDTCLSRHALHPDYSDVELPRRLPVEAMADVPLERCSLAGESPAPVFSSRESHNSTELRKKLSADRYALEALTSYHRKSQAARLLVRGARPTADGDVVLNDWHARRVRALGERAARWDRCGELVFMAEKAGRTVPVEYACGDWRACARCRERRQFRLQRAVGELKRACVERLYKLEMSPRYAGREGTWSEKMFTGTCPHTGDVLEDKRLMMDAVKRFERRVNEHLQRRKVRKKSPARGNLSLIPWVRAYEVSCSEDGLHFHCHIWMIAPYLEQACLHAWWGDALLDAGLPPELMPYKAWSETGARDGRAESWVGFRDVVPWPVVDVRRASASKYAAKVGFASYVVKSDGAIADIEPVHAARVYEALSDMRVVQFAMGFSTRREAAGWHLRRATRMEAHAWAAKLDGNVRRVASARDEAPVDVSVVFPADACEATGPPETPKAPETVPPVSGAFQLSLFGGNY